MLSRQPELRAWLVVAKYATRAGKQLQIKEYLIQVLNDAGEDFRVIMRYIVETYNNYDESVVREIIRAVHPEEENTMMSQFAQDIIAKGKPDWLKQGRQEDAATMLLKQMNRKFGQLPDWITEKVKSEKLELIETWCENIIFANSLDDVFTS